MHSSSKSAPPLQIATFVEDTGRFVGHARVRVAEAADDQLVIETVCIWLASTDTRIGNLSELGEANTETLRALMERQGQALGNVDLPGGSMDATASAELRGDVIVRSASVVTRTPDETVELAGLEGLWTEDFVVGYVNVGRAWVSPSGSMLRNEAASQESVLDEQFQTEIDTIRAALAGD